MSFIIKEKSYEPVKKGLHHAILYAVYDIGTHDYKNQSSRKCVFIWEVPEQRMFVKENGKVINCPKSISKIYTASLNKKSTLRKHLESWKGRELTREELENFDLSSLLGESCTIQVIHKTNGDKTNANVEAVLPLYNANKKEPENKSFYFSIQEHDRIPDNTPQWIRNFIEKSDEWQGRSGDITFDVTGEEGDGNSEDN